MLRRYTRFHSEKQHVADCPHFTGHFDKVTAGGVKHKFASVAFAPFGRICGRLFGIVAVKSDIDAAHKPQAVNARTKLHSLMMIGRLQPFAGFGDNFGAVMGSN